MPIRDKKQAQEIWFNPFLRVRIIGSSLTSTKYGNARIASRFASKLHHEADPVTVDLIRMPTSELRERWSQQPHMRQAGGFHYNTENSTLIYGRPSRGCERYCQICIDGKHIQILFNQQYAAYTFLRPAKIPHPTRLAATLANLTLIRQGIFTFHGAAIEAEHRGVAILGVSNTGKTLSTIQLCQNKGWRLLADDVFIVDRSGTLFPNPFTTSLDFTNPVRHKLLGWLFKDSHERWGTLERYPSVEIGSPSPVDSIFILEKRGWGNGMQQLTAQEAAGRIMVQNALEFNYISDPFLQRLAYFEGWNVIELFQTAYDIALSFTSHAKEVHELVAPDTESLTAALQASLTNTTTHASMLDDDQSSIASC